jgi:hypothetical protein
LKIFDRAMVGMKKIGGGKGMGQRVYFASGDFQEGGEEKILANLGVP